MARRTGRPATDGRRISALRHRAGKETSQAAGGRANIATPWIQSWVVEP